MTEVDGKEDFAGNDVAAVRPVLDQADRADSVRCVLAGDGVDALDHPRRADESVFAQPHRRRAGVRFLAGDSDFVPAHALDALDNANHALFVFENGALLDVQFKHGAEFACARGFAAAIADALQFVAECLAVAVGPSIGIIRREDAGEHARGQHGGREARAFFIGPIDDLDRRIGFVAGFVQRAHGFERAKDAQRAVEFAAGRLGVEMRAHGDRRQVRIFARPAHEHVADLIDGDGAAQRLALRLEPIAHLAVEIGQGEPADTAFRRAADLRRLHQRVPQPLWIDGEVL